MANDSNGRDRSWLLAVALVVLTGLAYQPVWHAGFIWDDHEYVANNTTLRTWDGLQRIWLDLRATPQYYPLTHTSFWVEYHLWRLDPMGYHAVNVGWHALNAILVWLVLRRLAVNGAWLAAALFALHPVHVESVAWITERKNVLAGFFYLSALLAYLRFLPGVASDSDLSLGTPSQHSGKGPQLWKFYGLALALYGGALLSKSVTCTLPVAILLLLWWKRGSLRWREAWALLPFLALGVGAGLTTLWTEKHVVGAQGNEWAFSLSERCLIAGRAVWFYLGKLVWPVKLVFFYPRWQVDSTSWWQYRYPLGVAGAVAGLWAGRERWGRGPLVAAGFFVVTLGPALGFFDVFPFRYSFVADHFQYLASIGMIACAAAGVARGLGRAGLWRAPVGNAVCAVLLVTIGSLTWRQGRMYCDEETLYRATIRQNPDAWMAHNNLGNVLVDQGKLPEAMAEYRATLRIKPDHAKAHFNLGLALTDQGNVAEAIDQYEQALRFQPGFAEAHYHLGNALFRLGHVEEAMFQFQEALRTRPSFAEAHGGLGTALVRAGRISDALAEYREAVRLDPGSVEAHNNLGLTLAGLGGTEEAVAEYREALRIDPRCAEAHNNLGNVMVGQGKFAEAAEEYREALRINSLYAEAHGNLGLVLAGLGWTAEAVAEYREALRINPGYAEAHYSLGVLLEKQGDTEEALAHYRDAVRLRPDWPQALNRLARLRAMLPPSVGSE